MSTTVFIIDDHPIFRAGLTKVLESEPDLTLVGEASSGKVGLEKILQTQPQISVVDIELPDMDGLTLARELQKHSPPLPVITLTMHKEENIFNRAMDAGVKGYILKENAASDLIEGIHAVARGDFFLSPTISGYLLNRAKRQEKLSTQFEGLAKLTPMERRILKLTAQNQTCKEIGKELFISHRTVETHRNNIAQKLNLRGNHKLLQFAIEHRFEL